MYHLHRKSQIFQNLNEGINISRFNKTVSFDNSHERNVDTSLLSNPSYDEELSKSLETQTHSKVKITVKSIFRRKRGNFGDGNPLLYALKEERGWKFASEQDKEKVLNQFDKIADKFMSEHHNDIAIVVPSSNRLNLLIAETIQSKNKEITFIEGLVEKMTTEDVYDMVQQNDSKFFNYYSQKGVENLDLAFDTLSLYLNEMDEKHNGYFTRHIIEDQVMRNQIDATLKVSTNIKAENANLLNGRDILIIDDTISRGQTIKEMCSIIQDTYAPESITILTLFSRL